MKRASLSLAVLCWAGMAPGPVGAEPAPGPGPTIRVLAEPGTQGCPGATELAFELDRSGSHRVRIAAPGERAFDVHFSLTPTGHRARIQSPGGRVRTLDDTGSSCAELGKATGLALSLMLEDAARRRPVPEPVRPPSPEPVPAPTSPLRLRLLLTAGVGAGLGGPRPVVGLGAGLTGPWDVELLGRAALPEKTNHGPGVVELSWQELDARGCPELFDALDLRPCAGLSLTRLSARGRGYDASNEQVVRWLPGATLSFRLRGALIGALGWRLGGELNMHPTRERFVVAGVEGSAFETRRVSGHVTLGLDGTF